MAQLVSPGVSVSIIDESAYASAGAGTVPVIVLATAAGTAPLVGALVAGALAAGALGAAISYHQIQTIVK